MKKDNAITKRLKESIKEIEVDYKKDASISLSNLRIERDFK